MILRICRLTNVLFLLPPIKLLKGINESKVYEDVIQLAYATKFQQPLGRCHVFQIQLLLSCLLRIITE